MLPVGCLDGGRAVQAHAHFSFGTQTACLAINYLDYFLSVYDFTSDKFWSVLLVAVACLSLAAKLEDISVPPIVAETKPTQASLMPSTKTFKNSASFNLRPPPVDRHKSFDEGDLSVRHITTKKVNISWINAISYSITDLYIATNSFNNEDLIGEGSTGRVYRAQFDDGRVLVVEKISPSALPSHLYGEFINMVSDISQLRHPNVAKLVGSYSEHGQYLA